MLEKGGGWRPPHPLPQAAVREEGRTAMLALPPGSGFTPPWNSFPRLASGITDRLSPLPVLFPALLPVAKGVNVFTLKQQLPLTGCQALCETPSHIVLFNPHNYPGLPWWFSDKESTCQCRRHGFDPRVGIKRWGFYPSAGKISWRWEGQPTSVPLPGESHGQRRKQVLYHYSHLQSPKSAYESIIQ